MIAQIFHAFFAYKEWLFSGLVGLVTYYTVQYYLRVYRYPRGPFPLPLIGNLLMFRGSKRNVFFTMEEACKKYGSVCTLWTGPNPFILISDLDLMKEAFNSKNNEFLGRPHIITRRLLTDNGKHHDVVFNDDLPSWASLRRVAHSAVRKYAANEKLALLVSDVVDETVNIIKKEEANKPFNPVDYLYFTLLNIIATTAFGKRYQKGDAEFHFIKENLEGFRRETEGLAFADLPVIKWYYAKTIKRVIGNVSEVFKFAKSKFIERSKDFEEGVVRDFSDAMISAKNEALEEGKESAPFLVEQNLALVLVDLFIAGVDTTQYTMRWILFFMAKFPEMQRKMRKEIEEEIGDRIPVQDDKLKLNFVMAYIHECLRYRGIVSTGVPHRALSEGKIGDYNIPYDKNVMVSGFQWMVHHNPKYWPEPHRFLPDRFLEQDTGKFLNAKPVGFVPFGIGKRICLGEKLALEDLFLITVRILQDTNGMMFEFPDGPDSFDDEPDPKVLILVSPKPYKLVLK